MEMFNWVDYTIIGIIILSIIISLVRGFMRESLSLIMWVLAIWMGFHFYEALAQWLVTYISSKPIRTVAAFFILFFFTLLIGAFISFILVKFVHKTGLSGTDRALGGVFGLARGVVLAAVLLLIASLLLPSGNLDDSSALKKSKLAPKFKPMTDWLKEFLPDTDALEKTVKGAKLPDDMPKPTTDGIPNPTTEDVPSLPV